MLRRGEAEAQEETDEVSRRGPLELGERRVEVSRDQRAGGTKAMNFVADRPAGGMHGREHAMRQTAVASAHLPDTL